MKKLTIFNQQAGKTKRTIKHADGICSGGLVIKHDMAKSVICNFVKIFNISNHFSQNVIF